jgi:hypothetical protein
VTDAQVSAEVAKREALPERRKLSVITILARPADAKPGQSLTDADWARAQKEIKEIATAIRGGADFAATAKAKSRDSSASSEVAGLGGS